MQEEKIITSSDKSKDSTPILQQVMDSPRCNNADTDCYMRIATHLLLIDPKIEMPLELCKEENVTLASTFPTVDSQLPH